MNTEEFKYDDWVKIWEGKWSLLTCTYFGVYYTKDVRFGTRPVFSKCIIFASNGRSYCYIRQEDRDILGTFLSKQVQRDATVVSNYCKDLKTESIHFIKFMDINIVSEPTVELYNEFWERLRVYYQPHIAVKYVVDYLDTRVLKKFLPQLQKARLAAEPVFQKTEDFLIAFCKKIGKKVKLPYKLLLCLTKEEMHAYFKSGTLPKRQELEQRNKQMAMVHDAGEYVLYTGAKIKAIEHLVVSTQSTSEIRGATAFPGKVTGSVRIVVDPAKARFKAGEILITGMTRPDFLPLLHKAAAFVTDAGGILSHAAIVARELKKPCVIGTKNATKIFKDGDVVEVDADKGIVKKIK